MGADGGQVAAEPRGEPAAHSRWRAQVGGLGPQKSLAIPARRLAAHTHPPKKTFRAIGPPVRVCCVCCVPKPNQIKPIPLPGRRVAVATGGRWVAASRTTAGRRSTADTAGRRGESKAGRRTKSLRHCREKSRHAARRSVVLFSPITLVFRTLLLPPHRLFSSRLFSFLLFSAPSPPSPRPRLPPLPPAATPPALPGEEGAVYDTGESGGTRRGVSSPCGRSLGLGVLACVCKRVALHLHCRRGATAAGSGAAQCGTGPGAAIPTRWCVSATGGLKCA